MTQPDPLVDPRADPDVWFGTAMICAALGVWLIDASPLLSLRTAVGIVLVGAALHAAQRAGQEQADG